MNYDPIDEATRCNEDIRRGNIYSILPAYTANGYIPCTGIKQGFYNVEDFLKIEDRLLVCRRIEGLSRPVIRCLGDAERVFLDMLYRDQVVNIRNHVYR